jgi:hypothetical protein
MTLEEMIVLGAEEAPSFSHPSDGKWEIIQKLAFWLTDNREAVIRYLGRYAPGGGSPFDWPWVFEPLIHKEHRIFRRMVVMSWYMMDGQYDAVDGILWDRR